MLRIARLNSDSCMPFLPWLFGSRPLELSSKVDNKCRPLVCLRALSCRCRPAVTESMVLAGVATYHSEAVDNGPQTIPKNFGSHVLCTLTGALISSCRDLLQL
jgi:hypothetical protein